MKLRHGQAVALMVLVTLLWSTAGVVARQLESARSFELTFWRSAFTALSLFLLLPLWQGRGVWARMWQSGALLWVSGACWAAMFTCFMLALTLTSVANVLITLALGPLLTALIARLGLGHRLPARTWGAILLAGLGIGWIYGGQIESGGWTGILVAAGVPLSGAINWTLVQRNQQRGNPPDLAPAVLVGAVLSALLTLPLAWPLQASGPDLAWLAGLGFGQLALPCLLSVVCARSLSAPEISLLALLEVLFGIVLAWLGANELPPPRTLQGGALVLGALLANEWLAYRSRARSHSRIRPADGSLAREPA